MEIWRLLNEKEVGFILFHLNIINIQNKNSIVNTAIQYYNYLTLIVYLFLFAIFKRTWNKVLAGSHNDCSIS